ncbi:MAG: S8 family serine peptidase [Bacteroidota bacterium]
MRTLITIFSLLLTTSAFAQINEGIISSGLLEKIEADPEAVVSFYISLSEQVDVKAMNREFYAKKATQQERVATLVPALQEMANATQPPFLEALRKSIHVEAGSIHPLWIANMIYAKGSYAIIAELSQMDNVEWIDLDRKIYLHRAEEVACEVGISPNGSEPGHAAIKADKLWAMGYTGYGTRAMIVDTGTDQYHPALEGNYVGLYFGASLGYTGVGTESIDCDDHGTHVAGTCVGLDRANNDTTGVAFNALWIGSPAIDCGASNSTLGTNQIWQWAINPDGNLSTTEDMPAVINNSWGIPTHDEQGNFIGSPCGMGSMSSMNAVEAAGIAIVFSSGNNGIYGASTVSNPADLNITEVIPMSTAAVNGASASLPIAGFSSRGPTTCSGTGSLKIKPEVAAPGVNVRSSIVGGGYSQFSGTSMASPHVAGAVCLLKEAFPNLTGETIKLALYNTARDLGTPGEDNDYGNGIIDVLEAFEYLVGQGNTPVEPQVQHDALLASFEMDDLFCGGSFTGTIEIENGGTSTLSSVNINYEIKNGTDIVMSGTETWSGSLATGERASYTFPDFSGLNGSFDLEVTLESPNGNADARPLNNKLMRNFITSGENPLNVELVGGVQAEPCGSSNALLFLGLEEASLIEWYVQPNGGNPVATGPYYLTPALPTSFTFYADVTLESAGGIIDVDDTANEVGDDDGGGLIFDVFTDMTLKTVTVFADAPGFRLISVRNASNVSIGNKTINLTSAGEHIIELDIDIPPGDGYQLRLDAGGDLLFSTAPNFPYSIGGAMSIQRSTDFVDPKENYYYFYNWVIENKFICGRAPVTVDFVPTTNNPVAEFAASTTVVNMTNPNPVSFTNNSVNGSTYLWNFGDGNTSTAFEPSHIFNQTGTFTVSLTVINADGCSDSELIEIVVEEVVTSISELEAQNQIKVFPNPTRQLVNVSFDFDETQNVEVRLVDILGRQVNNLGLNNYQNDQIQVDLSNYTNGIYYLVFDLEGTKVVKKVVKMD